MDTKPIPGFPGYEAHPDGVIFGKRTHRPLSQFWRGSDRSKYLCVRLYGADGNAVTRTVHSIILEAFISSRPAGAQGRHLDGDRSHNAVGNLAWGTRQENLADAYRHGTVGPRNLTRCVNGHEYTPENRLVNGKGKYRCGKCHAARERARHARRKEL